MRFQTGQSTVEYLAVVLLVAGVMGATGALLLATGIGASVVAQLRHALCIVSGDACDRAQAIAAGPCVRTAREHTDGGHLQVLVARIGNRDVVLREQRADGTVAITLIDESEGGLDVGTGLEAHVRWGEHSWAVGSELRAAILAGRASGRTWIAPDDAAATRIVDRVRLAALSKRPEATIAPTDSYSPYPPMRPEVHAPDPDVTFSERSGGLTLDLGSGSQRAVRLSGQEAYGERIDHRTGDRTVYVRTRLGARGRVSFAGSAAGAGEERLGITLDRTGRPVDLAVLSTLDVEGAAELPPRLSRIAGWLRIPLRGSRHVEAEQHLDLTDPASAAPAQAFLGAFGDGALGVRLAASALRERLAQSGTLGIRTYATAAQAHQVGGHAKMVGVGIGAEAGSEDESGRLLSAVTRGPEGRWTADRACGPLPA